MSTLLVFDWQKNHPVDHGGLRELPDEAVTQTNIVLGKKGGGKTYFLGVLEEEFASHKIPFTVVDPIGAHWGIKEKYPVIVFGGPKGDVPLDPAIGKQVAGLIANTDISCILDLQDFSKTGQRRFVADFTEELYRINRRPRHLIYEEADLWIPQTHGGELSRVYDEVDNITRRGRQKGIGVSVVSQRPAKLSKDAVSQGDLYLFFRMPGTQDRQAAVDFLEGVAEPKDAKIIYGVLPTLETGHCIVYSPEWLNIKGDEFRVRKRQTYHAGRTPKLGEKQGFEPTPVDVSTLAPKLTEMIKGLVQETDEVTDLKKRLEQMEKTIEQKDEQLRIRGEIRAVLEHTGIKTTVDDLPVQTSLAEFEKTHAEQVTNLNRELAEKTQLLAEATQELEELQPVLQLKLALDHLYGPLAKKTIPTVDPAKPEWAVTWLGKLPEAPKKLLQCLIENPWIHTKVELAEKTGYAVNGGGFGKALRILKRNNIVKLTKKEVRLA